MWSKSHSQVIKSAHKEEIWERLSDVNNWHEWIPNVEYCQLEKPFQAGSRFILKPKGAKAVIVQLENVEKKQKFTACTRFFGATMQETYEMQSSPEGVHLTVTLAVTGPLGFLWRLLVAEKIADHLSGRMENLTSVIHTPRPSKTAPNVRMIAEVGHDQPSPPTPKKPHLQLVASAPKTETPKATPSAIKKAEPVGIEPEKGPLQPKPKKPAAKKFQASAEASTAKKEKTAKPKNSAAKKKEKPKVEDNLG